MTSKKLILIGASGNAHDVLDTVEAINQRSPMWDVVGFLDDNWEPGGRFLGYPFLGNIESARQYLDCQFINCIGSDHTFRQRRYIVERADVVATQYATLIHPLANVSRLAKVGLGVSVSFAASIGGHAVIEDHVMIGPGVIIGHDSVVEKQSVIAPGAVISGHVKVRQSVYLGARSVIKPERVIGESAIVGMGAVVTRNVERRSTVAGVPARAIADSIV